MDGVRSGDEIDVQSQLVKMISSQFNIRYSSYYPDATSKKIRRHAPSWDGSEWESCQSSKKVRCALQQSDCLVLLAPGRQRRPASRARVPALLGTSKIPDNGGTGVQMPGRIQLSAQYYY